jgi:hypothetical protein
MVEVRCDWCGKLFKQRRDAPLICVNCWSNHIKEGKVWCDACQRYENASHSHTENPDKTKYANYDEKEREPV